MADPHNLQRFVDAQDPVYAAVRAELQAGHKATHWMWFIFPQLTELGHSATAKRFGIGSLGEARAYLAHPILGLRLTECTRLLLAHPGAQPIAAIMGDVDALKLRSCMTLFRVASGGGALFQAVLDRYYGGQSDELTIELLTQA